MAVNVLTPNPKTDNKKSLITLGVKGIITRSEVLPSCGVLLFFLFFYRCVYGCMFCILLFNSVGYVFLCYVYVLLLCILCSVYSIFIMPTGILWLP